MDWAIHVSSSEEVSERRAAGDIKPKSAGIKLAPIVDLTLQLIDEYFGSIKFSRCIYGNEFCEHLIPSTQQLEAVLQSARDRGLSLTFVSPYVSDEGIETLRPLLELLNNAPTECEVVFNDWGVLNLLQSEFPRLTPVQGRLMNKSLRDPRVTSVYATSEAPGPALVSLRRS